MPNLDICILTAGRFDLLEKCLDAVEREIKLTPCNVYLFDNGSPTEERLKNSKLFSRPFITKHKRGNHNVGFPAGVNTLINMAEAPLVLFLSDDIILQPGAIQSLLKTMEEKTIGMCGLKLLFPENTPNGPAGKVQHVGHSVNLRGDIIHPFMGWSADNPRCCKSQEVFSITGGAFIIRRELFKRVRGFNPVYGKGYYEDVELALQLRGLGYKIWIDCNAVAEHYVGATFSYRQENPQMQQNKEIFMSRNGKRLQWTDWIMR